MKHRHVALILEETLTLHASTEPTGLYCHVPFCPATCGFCAFHQQKPFRKDVVAFLGGVEQEAAIRLDVRKVDTFYFGGGTPGLLSARDLARLGRTFLDRLDAPPAEWTLEMAPSTVNKDKMRALQDLGVNRLSMGVQSFDENLLARIGRPHTPVQVHSAYDTVRCEGFENVNLDLIFAVPGQTLAMLEEDLGQAIRLEPRHISTYCLTYEEDTPLWHALSRGQVKRDIEMEADLYLKTWEILEGAGYVQYEVSNFALPGFECMHNLNTWKMHQWIGIGPSAASQYKGARFTNPKNLEEWLEGLDAGVPIKKDEVCLSKRLLAEDAVLFGLRMSQGVSPAHLAQRFEGIDLSFLDPLWRDLNLEGLLEKNSEDHLALTLKGKLLADRIGGEVMSAFEASKPRGDHV